MDSMWEQYYWHDMIWLDEPFVSKWKTKQVGLQTQSKSPLLHLGLGGDRWFDCDVGPRIKSFLCAQKPTLNFVEYIQKFLILNFFLDVSLGALLKTHSPFLFSMCCRTNWQFWNSYISWLKPWTGTSGMWWVLFLTNILVFFFPSH